MGRTAQWLDFNEIEILLTLEASQPDRTKAKSANEILAMRRAGQAWDEIGRALGCRDLDAIVKRAGPQPRAHGRARSSALSNPPPKGGRRHVA